MSPVNDTRTTLILCGTFAGGQIKENSVVKFKCYIDHLNDSCLT